jgi:Domain of unknown function (DUF4349)
MTTLEHELEIALRAEAPRPSAEFARKMDARAAAGFPRESRPRLPAIKLWPALAAGAALIIAVAIAVPLLTRGGGGSSDSFSTAASRGEAAKSAPRVASAQTAPAAPLPGVRRVERSAALTLGAPKSKLDDVANQIVAVVDRRHGFVLHSSVTSGDSGQFELRVPSASLQATLGDLSALADVRSRTQTADDITQAYNSVGGQLSEARATRHSLLGRLAKATTDTEAQALKHRIRLVSAQIRSLSARFAQLQARARYATIDVTLVRERAHHGAAATGVSGDFHDALHSLAVSFGIALRVLGVAVPLALLGGLGWLGGAILRRRRREAALF